MRTGGVIITPLYLIDSWEKITIQEGVPICESQKASCSLGSTKDHIFTFRFFDEESKSEFANNSLNSPKIWETVLGCESKKQSSKISCYCPFKEKCRCAVLWVVSRNNDICMVWYLHYSSKGQSHEIFSSGFFSLNQLILVLLEMSTPKAVLIFSLTFSLSYLTLKTNPRYLLLLNPCLCQNDCYLKKIHIFFIPQIQRKAWSTSNPGYRSKLL